MGGKRFDCALCKWYKLLAHSCPTFIMMPSLQLLDTVHHHAFKVWNSFMTHPVPWMKRASIHALNESLTLKTILDIFCFSFYNSLWGPVCGSQLDSSILISLSICSCWVCLVLYFLFALSMSYGHSISFVNIVTWAMRLPERWQCLMCWRPWCKLFKGNSVLSNPMQVFQAVHRQHCFKGTQLCQ